MIRRCLDRLYDACGWLAGAFLLMIALFTLYAIGGGLFGYIARSADEFAGYAMAAASFLGFASTFRKGEHIRVELLLQRLKGIKRRLAEIWCLIMGAGLSSYLAWFSVKLAYDSWRLNDVSQGLIAVPLWLPQLGMAAGAVVFAIALFDQTFDLMRGGALPIPGTDDPRADR